MAIKNADLFLLILASLILILSIAILPLFYFVLTVNILFLAIFILFIAYAVLLLERGKGIILKLLPILMLILLIAQINYTYFIRTFTNIFGLLYNMLFWFFFYIPVIFLIFFGFFIYRKKPFKHAKKIAVVLFVIAIALLLFYYTYIITSWTADDEIVIQYFSAKSIIALLNPYTQGYGPVLFSNLSNVAVTLTTKNGIADALDYPALYPLSGVPFTALSSSLSTYKSFGMKIEIFATMCILFFSIGYFAKEKILKKLSFTALIGILIALAMLSSAVQALMLALLVIAYATSGKKYGWIAMGLAASMQELLWIPVLLLLTYTFINFGYRKMLRELSLTVIVFIAINAPFMLLNLNAFANDVIFPMASYIFPNDYAPVGYFITLLYPIPLHSFSILFGISVLMSLSIFIYFNDKRLVALLSLLPLTFLDHAIPTYYAFFIGFLLISININYRKGKVDIAKYKKGILAASAVLALAAVVFVLAMHAIYSNNFSISNFSQGYSTKAAANSTQISYNITFSYSSKLHSFYTLLDIYSNGSTSVYGIEGFVLMHHGNLSISNINSSNVNPNVMLFNGNGTYAGNYSIYDNIGKNSYLQCIIYNSSYIYFSTPIKLKPLQKA
jgi:hypothetical protein